MSRVRRHESSEVEGAAQPRLTEARELLSSEPGSAVEKAQQVLEAATDPSETASALLLIGEGRFKEGRPAEAHEPLRRARELFLETGDDSDLIATLLLLARVEREMALLAQAAERTSEALSLARRVQDLKNVIEALNIHAGVVSSQGRHVEAIGCLEEALGIARGLGMPDQEANLLSNLGNLRRQLGDYPRALDSLKAAYELMRKTAAGSRGEAVNLINLGHLYGEMNDQQAAQDFFSQAREVGRQSQDVMIEAASLNSLANTVSGSGDWSSAAELYREALEISRSNGLRQYEIDNLDGIGQVHAARGEFEEARQAHLQALEVSRETGEREGEIDALLNLGRDYLELRRFDDALEILNEALGLAEAHGRNRALYEAHELLSRTHQSEGRFEEALRHHQEFYRAEKAVFNEESKERVRRLTVQFDLERARHEAETYRVRTEVAQKAQEQAEASVRERTRELEEAQQEIVARLAIAGEYRDDGTGEHTRRVGRHAGAIARELGWSDADAELLASAARLHDVGKIGIRDAVLLKPGRLNEDEFESMRAHTVIGGRILSGGHSRLLRMAEEIAFAHHERWDGHGYPDGLQGDEIPMAARIVSVADVLDALINERPYKGSWTLSRALAEIERNSGSQFDPDVVDACLKLFRENGERYPLDGRADETDAPVRRAERRVRSGVVSSKKGAMEKIPTEKSE